MWCQCTRASLLLFIRERLLSTQLVSASMTGDYYYSFYLILSTRRASRRNTTSLHYGYFAAASAATRISHRPPHLTARSMLLMAGVVSLFLLVPKRSFCYLVPALLPLFKVLKCSNNCERLRRGIKKEKRERERGLSCLWIHNSSEGKQRESRGIEQVMHTQTPPLLSPVFLCLCTAAAVAATNCAVHWTYNKQKSS